MISAVQNFSKTQSLETLYGCLNTPLANGEWGVLAFDLDQTLIQARPTLGDEHFYRFLMKQNREMGINPDAHYHWTVKIRANVTYEACESVEKINRIIASFQKQGWTVKILTSRGADMKDITMKHLQESGVDLTLDDVIFKEFHVNGCGKLLRKNESLIKWMKSQPRWKTRETLRVLFLDDSEKYCREVARVTDEVEKASVTCFHYIGSLPNPELSQVQMERLVVQLYAYREGRPIPYEYEQTQLQEAMCGLGIQEIKPNVLHATMMKIAELDKFPFTMDVK